MNPGASGHFGAGLVDHDKRLRHELLGLFQVITMVILVLDAILPLLVRGMDSPRRLILPFVLGVGLLLQRVLWKRGRDTVAANIWVGTFFFAFVVGCVVNGFRSPTAIMPIVVVTMAGYMLGSKVAWRYAVASLVLLWLFWLSERTGWIRRDVPPATIWLKVLCYMLVTVVVSLLVPIQGLLSAMALMDRTRADLDIAVEELRARQDGLEHEVQTRTGELTRANADLQSFSHSLSHDLQTPLRTILGFSEIVSESELDDRQKAWVAQIAQRSKDLEAILQRTLEHSRGRRPE